MRRSTVWACVACCTFAFSCGPKRVGPSGPCDRPATADVYSRLGLELSFEQSTFGKVVAGEFDLKTNPQIVNLLSAAARDSDMRAYVRCRALRDGFSRDQAAWLEMFHSFMGSNPTPDQITKFVADNSPFRNATARDERNRMSAGVRIHGKVTERGDVRRGISKAFVYMWIRGTQSKQTDEYGDFVYELPSDLYGTTVRLWAESPPKFGPSAVIDVKLVPPIETIILAVDTVRSTPEAALLGRPASYFSNANDLVRVQTDSAANRRSIEIFYSILDAAGLPGDTSRAKTRLYPLADSLWLERFHNNTFRMYASLGALTINDCLGQVVAPVDTGRSTQRDTTKKPIVFVPGTNCREQWVLRKADDGLWRHMAFVSRPRSEGM